MRIRFPSVLPFLVAGAILVLLCGHANGQTNLALTATATDSGGGQVIHGYGPQNMNDNNWSSRQWISTSSTIGAWGQLTWSSQQTLGYMTMHTSGTSNRFLSGATIQYWNGSTWVNDSTYSNQTSTVYTINFAQARTTTRLRITNMIVVGSQSSNPWIVEWQVYATPGPPVPASITVPASSTTGNYTVSWASSTGATGYDLEEDTSAGFSSPTQVYTGAGTSFALTNKPAGTYWYRVRASSSLGNSAWRTSTNGCVVQIPPAAPTSITVPAQSITGNYTVNWASSTGATGYDLEEDSSASFTNPTQVYTGANTTYNVTGKTTGTFYYRVRATNTWGNSGWTTGTNGCQMVPPAAPASITVPASSVTGSYTVSWSSSTGATGYDLEEDTSASFSNPITAYTGTNTTFNVTGKTVGTFYYRVRATGVAGSSGWTTGANGCQMVPPNAPSSITVPATSVTGNYTVFWTAEAGATSYDLEEATDAGFTNPMTVYSGSNINLNVTGKTSGTYYYRVRSVGVAGSSGWTAGANGCQIVSPNPPVPLTVPATSTTGTYTVSWGASQGAEFVRAAGGTLHPRSVTIVRFRRA